MEKEKIEEKPEEKSEEKIEEKIEEKPEERKEKTEISRSRKGKYLFLVVLFLLLAGVVVWLLLNKDTTDDSGDKKAAEKKVKEVEVDPLYSDLRMSGNGLENFDLSFLQLEGRARNTIYSPLSIKYALEMLGEGAEGQTKAQIDAVVGDYVAKKYNNNANMSFANALFIKDSFKGNVNKSYVNTLSDKYYAEVMYDSFESPKKINDWVSKKTFNLINDLVDDPSSLEYMIINALAIDMEWVEKIRDPYKDYSIDFKHEDYSKYIGALAQNGYKDLTFKGYTKKVKAVEIGAVANKYDIFKELGEEKIRKTVQEAFEDYKKNDEYADPNEELDMDEFLDELKTNYKHLSSSTDFLFHVDDNVKVFAKDLKDYNGVTLQYVAIMPKNEALNDFVKNIKAEDINKLITNLKELQLDNFEDGVITNLHGYIPMFDFDYELDLMTDLKKMGIQDVFDSSKANLSGLSSNSGTYIEEALHKAKIEFSNDGIKAAAATAFGGAGAAGGGFDYLFEVPVKEIDLSFDGPFIFLIRDKKSGEIWFVGQVYEPTEWKAEDMDFQ